MGDFFKIELTQYSISVILRANSSTTSQYECRSMAQDIQDNVHFFARLPLEHDPHEKSKIFWRRSP